MVQPSSSTSAKSWRISESDPVWPHGSEVTHTETRQGGPFCNIPLFGPRAGSRVLSRELLGRASLGAKEEPDTQAVTAWAGLWC